MRLKINLLREALILTTGLTLIGLALWLDRRDKLPVTAGTLRSPLAGSDNPLDRRTYRVPDQQAAQLADSGLYGGPTLPLLFALHPRTRPGYHLLLLVWFETLLINFGITSSIKNSFNRPRPYVLHPDFQPDRPLTRNDRAAFLSGHASIASAGSTLFIMVLLNCFKPSLSRTALLTAAAALPLTTAYLRVKSAKHWPTDAVAGLLLGGIVAKEMLGLHRV